jgi:thiamine kinase-like enzyme
MMTDDPTITIADEPITEAASRMMHQAGFRGPVALVPLSGGANNRVFRVESDSGTALLKAYFQHPDDPRDRLGTEFAFASFAWERGIRCIPQPLAYDCDHALGLYKFVAGRRLEPAEVGDAAVSQALAFYRALNQHRHHPQAHQLPPASEACFTIADHLATVERRLQRLERIDDTQPINRDAVRFIQHDLQAVWQTVHAAVASEVPSPGLALDTEVSPTDRCLSPSDFGFHNAILSDSDQQLRFLDFEYAGWDDPAKLVGDFFCQPAVPVPMAYVDQVTEVAAEYTTDPPAHRARFRRLLPVYQVKWCCIMLNDFLPAGSARRRFADTATDQEARKAQQLQKARVALQRIV